jgi:hypothetical protein
LREQRVLNADVTALDAVAPKRYRWPRQEVPYFSLVARTRGSARSSITLAEGLRGEDLLEQVKAEVVRAGRLEHLRESPDE